MWDEIAYPFQNFNGAMLLQPGNILEKYVAIGIGRNDRN